MKNTTTPNASRWAVDRADVVMAMTVGALGVTSCAIYLWMLSLAPDVQAAMARPPVVYAAWIVLTALQAVPLVWHRRAPVRVFTTVFALYLVASWLIGDAGTGAGASMAVWFGVYAVVAHAPPRTSGPLVIAAWSANVAVQAWLFAESGLGTVTPQLVLTLALNRGLFYAASAAIGLAVRILRHRAHDAHERAELAASRSAAEVARAVAEERNRMARELHDLAAHQLVDVLLAARTMKLQITNGAQPDPDLVHEIVDRGGDALASLRAAVEALREDGRDEEADEALGSRIHRVVTSAQASRGTAVRLELDPDLDDDVGPGQRHAVVSVLTEALANADRHATRQPVTVRIGATHDGSIRLEVSNPLSPDPDDDTGSTAGSGFGLIGARERAEILGGRLDTGPHDGTWRVVMTVPARPDEGDDA